VHNPRFRRALKLRDRRQRDKHGRFLIEGIREIRLALTGGISLEELFYCPAQAETAACQQLIDEAAGLGTQLFSLASELMDKLCFGERDEGLLAVAITPPRPLDGLQLPERALVAVLEGIEKPGNVGAIVRTADAAGVAAVVVADGGTDLFNPHAIRASLGTVFTVPIAAATSSETAAWLRQRGIHSFAARVDGAIPYTRGDFTQPCAIILGSEAQGLSGVWSGAECTSVCLQMHGAADSLNVSVTAAVMFYEAVRQRSAADT
jgi:TrmH family RNA methyltransferase